MKVLFILNYAPDYREIFLRELSRYVELTVVAQPCKRVGLKPPEKRIGYEYIEIKPIVIFGFKWEPKLTSVFNKDFYDVYCVSANLRQLSRLFIFIKYKEYRKKWIWWGHIVGKTKNIFLKKLRKIFLYNAVGCLTHNSVLAEYLKKEYGIKAVSFNNTEVSKNNFIDGVYKRHNKLHFLFVGRNQQRKRLDRLIELVKRRNDVRVKLIGSNMELLQVPVDLIKTCKIEVLGHTTGEELKKHFDWADIVVNPGHVGLLVMNAAKHGKGIVIDKDSNHAPEYILAKEAGQPFISFGNKNEVDNFIDKIKTNPVFLKNLGHRLQKKAV